MKDVVLVPAYNRPELLYLCLEHLSACPEIHDKEIWVRCESRNLPDDFLRDNKSVAMSFDVQFQMCRGHGYHGNSFNVLNAYKDAVESGASRIYLVEDDVLVSPDFFRWHDAMLQRDPDLFCSVGWHCLRRGDIPRGSTDPLIYFKSYVDYASIGVCWRASTLELVTKHCNVDYFNNPAGYIKRHFPFSPLSLDFSEQDGVVMRVLETSASAVAWPYRRRCSHVGWWGYHRPSAKRMTVSGPGPGYLSVRVDEARRILSSYETLREYSGDVFGGDTEPIIAAAEWQTKDLAQRML